jgi:hypothetical protein
MVVAERAGPRIQREFLTWYRQNAGRFVIPLRTMARSRRCLDLTFMGITPVISTSLFSGELIVLAKMDEQVFDIVADFEADPLHTPLGYVCKLCEPETREVYRTRTEFWRHHLFEEFLDWVNKQLAPARWICLSRLGDGGSTWATLIRDESELQKQDPTLLFMQQLKRLDGRPAYIGGPEGVTNCLITLRLTTN